MDKLDWMEWFGWRARPVKYRAAIRAGWTAIGEAFRTIAYLQFLRWQVERDRADWASLTSPHLEGIDSKN